MDKVKKGKGKGKGKGRIVNARSAVMYAHYLLDVDFFHSASVL
ncbi:MAG: hypothetical protein Q8Q98_15680 [Polaromonas sp.]|nr:hypothetical protein [Polaromonas sp.]